MMSAKQETPDALLFIAPGCPHCPTVLAALIELVKQALVGRMEVVNIAVHPQQAEQLGVRSVPWLRLGDFEFEGLHSPAELRRWAEKANTSDGLADYFAAELKTGRLPRVAGMVATRPERLTALLTLAEDPDTELAVRIGVSAVIEDLAGSPTLLGELPALQRLAASDDPRVRADACHFLALTESAAALPALEQLARDAERSVSDVAHDCLADLRDRIRT
jgi:thioredoxin-like negative regulator of GroEL